MSSWLPLRPQNTALKQDVNSLNANIILKPTFHILISTVGRPSLQNMLNSLKNELTKNDAITIIFDGEEALKNSSFSNTWLKDHKSRINIIENKETLGFWGHAARNKYQGILEPKTSFIMNADDDDEYVPGTFDHLRLFCTYRNTLYIAKMFVKKNDRIVPSQNKQILRDDIGTPCGIIPFDLANKSTWEYKYGGDFDYYYNLRDKIPHIDFLNLIIYNVL
jgi:hypothetical protein